ncbi:MAG: hypothetical protein ACJ8MO_42730, partial [Bacillus sp. (in: firmicutes)]
CSFQSLTFCRIDFFDLLLMARVKLTKFFLDGNPTRYMIRPRLGRTPAQLVEQAFHFLMHIFPYFRLRLD